ncbi:MAG: hypothetical protein HYS74_01845 [Parcubacteria group bacterium]|nr:hypothetical protein [Parcubacteria group bacterium]
MRGSIRRGLITIAGGFLIIVGITGIVLPFLQGFLFIVIGFYLLSFEYRWVRTGIEKCTDRYPKYAPYLRRIVHFLGRGE